MIQEQAKVVGLQGDQAIIEVDRQSGCSSCELNGACGTGSLGRLLGHRQKPFAVTNNLKLIKGDRVLLQLPENSLLLSGFLVYLLPLFFMFSFSIMADAVLGAQNWLNVAAALIGLFSGLQLSARIVRNRLGKSLQPHVMRHIG
jgi:sigma-E factor negative regulatory protein RseC